MLFRKKMDRCCEYCSKGTKMADDTVLCAKRGVVSAQFGCRKFSYDPCKRVPSRQKASDFSRYSPDDFTL